MEVLEEVLAQAGLDAVESSVYTALLNNGALTILEISKKAGLKRTNLYNILVSLENKHLVKKVQHNKKTLYFPNSPREIQNLLDLKETQINVARSTFELLIDTLQSKYSLVSHKPVITYLEGLTGLQKLYHDVNDTMKNICLFRSTHDDKRQDVDKLIQNQITEQVKRNIHARVIGPYEQGAEKIYLKYDKLRLVEQRFFTDTKFDIPAQILIYGNKTAITTIRRDIIITLIENEEISLTFKTMFEALWLLCEKEHSELVGKWK